MGQKRQRTADRLCYQNDEDQCPAYDQGDLEANSVEEHELGEVADRQGDTAERRDSHLFPQSFQEVTEFDLLQGNTADDRNTGLGARVTARIHQHGNIGSQDHIGGKCLLIAGNDRAGEGGRNHQEQKPRHSVLVGVKDSRPEIALVGGNDSCHLLDILRGLFLDDIDDVVDGDDTDHTVLVVHDGHSRKVVFLESAGRFFLVGKGVDTDDVLIHHFPDDRIGIENDQIAQGHGSDQDSLLVHNITDINRLGIQSDLADAVNRIADGHVLFEVDILDRHDTSCRILRIPQQMVDILSGLRLRVLEDLLDDVGRHLLQKVRSIVRHQVIDDAGCFLIGQRLDDVLLHFDLKVCEYVRRNPLGQDPEYSQGLLIFHLVHDRRDVRHVHVRDFLAELGVLFLLQKFPQKFAIFNIFIFHIHPPSLK